MFTKDENDKPEEEDGSSQLSFLHRSSTQRAPLLSRDNPNIVGHNPLMVHQFTRLMPHPQYATLVQVFDAEEIEPPQPVIIPGSKDIDDLTPPQDSLADRLAAVTEIYGGKAIPLSVSDEQLGFKPFEDLKFSPITEWQTYESDEENDAPPVPNISHKGPSLKEDLKREILYNAEMLVAFNGLYREANAEYILATEQYHNSKSNDDFIRLQRKEIEINLMSKPIIMAEKMHTLLSGTLETLERHGLDRGYERLENRNNLRRT